MAVQERLKNESMDDEKCHNLMTWHKYMQMLYEYRLSPFPTMNKPCGAQAKWVRHHLRSKGQSSCWASCIVALNKSNSSTIWATSRENMSSGFMCRSNRPEILDIASIGITLSRLRTTKALIRLRGCAGWSAPLLFAYVIRQVFSWQGSYYVYDCWSFQNISHIKS